MRPSFTLGIEEEYQTVDPETRDLRSHIATEMLTKGKLRLEERVKAEMHQSVIEVGTRICGSIQAAQLDLFDLRRNMIHLAEEAGLVLVAAQRTRSRTGARRRSIPTPVMRKSCRICNWWRGRTLSSGCMCMSALRIVRRRFAL